MSERCNIKSGVGCLLEGTYKVQIVDANTKKIVKDYPWQKNLILNGGMNAMASYYFSQANLYGICGSGSRPNSFGSGLSTITQSGITLELYNDTGDITSFNMATSSYSDIVEVGDMFQYGNGSESMVASVEDGTHLIMSNSFVWDETDQQTFRVWKTSQVGLEAESKRGGGNGSTIPGSSWLLNSPNCFSTNSYEEGSTKYRRTYDFKSESISRQFTEIGVSWTATKGAVGTLSTFSRALLPEEINVVPGMQLRLIHELKVTVAPKQERYITSSVTGWTTCYGTESIQNYPNNNTSITPSTADTYGYGGFEPAATSYVTYGFTSAISTSLAAYTSSISRYGTNKAWQSDGGHYGPYINNTFERIRSCSFILNNSNSTNIRCFGMGIYNSGASINPYDTSGQILVVLLDEDRIKTNEEKLNLIFKLRWGRVLA